ncbi:unnamed protein product, partial [marine sediment metagenome]
DIKELKKGMLNKDFLMKSEEELRKELVNKKYQKLKNMEDIYNRQ